MDWYLKIIKEKYADFSGRARRKEYWMFQLVTTLIVTALYVAVAVCFVLASMEIKGVSTVFMVLGIVAVLVVLVVAFGLTVPGLAVGARRLHDVGQSGWLLLLYAVPFGGIVLLIFLVMDSQPGDNEYGPNPKQMG